MRIFTPVFQKCFSIFFLLVLFAFSANSQVTLIDEHFNTNSLPAGITSDGAMNPTKAQDGVCSKGMIQVNKGQYLQVDVSSCGLITVNMKSTASSARALTVKYKKDGEESFSVTTTTLSVLAAASFNLSDLYPVLQSAVPVSIRIEPTDGNLQIHDLFVQSSVAKSSQAEITSFKIAGQIGNEVINTAAATIGIQLALGEMTFLLLVPQTISLSSQATISPSATAAQNFNDPVVYTVTAQDGKTKDWTVTVTQVASSAKEITAFRLAANQIGNSVINSSAGTILVSMPIGASLNNLVPVQFTSSAKASVSPAANTAQDFSTPVTYTITAQDNSTKTWTVQVSLVDPNSIFTDYEAEDALFTGTVDNNHLGYSGRGFINFLSADNSIMFTVCQQTTGVQTAKFRYSLANDTYRKGNLFVNDEFVKLLDFPRTATYDDWSEETVMVTLQAGINNIKITWDTTDGPNLDKLMLSGAACASYSLNVNASNGGNVIVSPERPNNKYFDVETVTLLGENKPALQFANWSGDYTGTENPVSFQMQSDKTITGNFTLVPTYKINTKVNGIGEILLSPAGGEYALGTVVTVTAKSILGSVFTGWSGSLSGFNPVAQITVDGTKNITGTFTSSFKLDFDKVVGFASVAAQGMTEPTKGGQCASDTVVINGPSEFNKLCESLYYRQSAYKKGVTTNGMKKAPLVILLKAGIYDGTQSLSTDGAKIFGNSMMDIPEQGDLTLIGEANVVFKIGINVKRAWNILIRNISFQDYYDDGINIGYPETHHIWIDHCTIGNPSSRPLNTEHPDGGIDIKDGASYVTISWCLYQNSWKTGLVGHSDNNGPTDIGRLKVTYANNYFLGTNSRNPRVRFGEVHVLNNMVENVSLYGIAAANSAYVYAENNFYLNTHWPMYADRTSVDFKAVYGNNTDGVYTSKTGNYPALGLKQVGNGYDDSGLPLITAKINPAMLNPTGRSIKFDELNPQNVFNPAAYYDYSPMTAEEVRVIVPMFAGANTVSFTNICGNVPLPLQLLSFNVTLVSNQAKAVWKTTDEMNMEGFDVERSTDGNSFKFIGHVFAENRQSNSYSVVDMNPEMGVSYYRLKMIDKNGKTTFSKVIAINNKEIEILSLYPNPVAKNMIVTHAKATSGAALKVMSFQGQTLLAHSVSAGSVTTSVDVSTLPKGGYLLIYENGTSRSTSKFVRQ